MNELIEIFGYDRYIIGYPEGRSQMISIGLSKKGAGRLWSLCIKRARLNK